MLPVQISISIPHLLTGVIFVYVVSKVEDFTDQHYVNTIDIDTFLWGTYF